MQEIVPSEAVVWIYNIICSVDERCNPGLILPASVLGNLIDMRPEGLFPLLLSSLPNLFDLRSSIRLILLLADMYDRRYDSVVDGSHVWLCSINVRASVGVVIGLDIRAKKGRGREVRFANFG